MCMEEQMKQNASKVHQANFCWRRNLYVYKRNESNKSSILLNNAAVKLGIVMTFIEAFKMEYLFILHQNESQLAIVSLLKLTTRMAPAKIYLFIIY